MNVYALGTGALFLAVAACEPPFADHGRVAALSTDEAEARSLCIAIGGDTTRLRVDTFALHGLSTESAEVTTGTLPNERDWIAVTYFGETGRLTQAFQFAHANLVCAEERTEQYDRPLSGIVVDATPLAVTYFGSRAAWFWALTAADSAAGRMDSLPAVSTRLRLQADTLRTWIANRRATARGRAP